MHMCVYVVQVLGARSEHRIHTHTRYFHVLACRLMATMPEFCKPAVVRLYPAPSSLPRLVYAVNTNMHGRERRVTTSSCSSLTYIQIAVDSVGSLLCGLVDNVCTPAARQLLLYVVCTTAVHLVWFEFF